MKFKSILALIMAALVCVSLAACGKAEIPAQNTQTTVATTTVPQVGEVGTELTPQEQLIFAQDGVFNLLMLGVDNINDVGASDTIMLLSIDRTNGKLKFTSFAKDTYVAIPGYGEHQLSAAYSLGGAALTVNTLEHNFGIDIERYALLNYYTFEDIVNIMGGISLDLSEQDVEHINSILRAEGGTTVTAQSGKIKLNGKQALAYIRTRGGKDSADADITRTQRQRAFMMEVTKVLSVVSATQLLELAKDVMPYVNTDITNDELNALLKGVRSYLTYTQADMVVPAQGKGTYVETEKGTMLEINDWATTRTNLKMFIYEE